MVRWLTVMFLLLAAGITTIAHAQTAKDAYKMLYALQKTVEHNMTRLDYARAYRDTEVEVDMYLKSKQADQNKALKMAIEKAWGHHQLIHAMIEAKVLGSDDSLVSDAGKKVEAVRMLLDK